MSEKHLNITEISKILPHRYPFLLVDRVLEIGDKKIVALKNVTRNEEFFNGHFPELPIMPGVLQIEALAQAAGIFILNIPENKGKIGFFASIEKARFKRPVIPGDQLKLEVEILKYSSRFAHVIGTATVEGEIACKAEMKFMMGSKDMFKEVK
ncbi:MAG: 3-hydroxyacyl-ACP dehydratase FabZ [Leptospirales bacterium]